MSPPSFDAVVLDLHGPLTSWGFNAAVAVAHLVFGWTGGGGGGGGDARGGGGDGGR